MHALPVLTTASVIRIRCLCVCVCVCVCVRKKRRRGWGSWCVRGRVRGRTSMPVPTPSSLRAVFQPYVRSMPRLQASVSTNPQKGKGDVLGLKSSCHKANGVLNVAILDSRRGFHSPPVLGRKIHLKS